MKTIIRIIFGLCLFNVFLILFQLFNLRDIGFNLLLLVVNCFYIWYWFDEI